MATVTLPSSNTPPSLPRLSGDEKALIILCHLSGFLGVGFILPLVVFLIKKAEGGPVAVQAKEVLNFHLSLLIYALCIAPLCFVFVGFILLPILAVAAIVLAIVAAIKASDGFAYRYPLCIRFIS
ncbi:MAG: DUF4870 domain-containing protein [Opitutus sp.]|nr:DUF4870 domain-containing protein [Opitutus sp.]